MAGFTHNSFNLRSQKLRFLICCLIFSVHLLPSVSGIGTGEANCEFHHYEDVQVATAQAQELYNIPTK